MNPCSCDYSRSLGTVGTCGCCGGYLPHAGYLPDPAPSGRWTFFVLPDSHGCWAVVAWNGVRRMCGLSHESDAQRWGTDRGGIYAELGGAS